MTLFGPVRLDVAGRLPWFGQQPGVEVLALDGSPFLSQGTGTAVHHEPIVSVHLSIGEAF
jgi:hypothetical protein